MFPAAGAIRHQTFLEKTFFGRCWGRRCCWRRQFGGLIDQTSWSGQGFDGRHALLPTAILFADEDGESQPAFINSIQFRNYKLSDEAVAALGGPAAEGIPTVSGQWDFESGDRSRTAGR